MCGSKFALIQLAFHRSEANDLALRLAREVTGGTEVIAIEGCVGGAAPGQCAIVFTLCVILFNYGVHATCIEAALINDKFVPY